MKIFSSKNKEKGRDLILELGIDKYLGISNLENTIMCDDIIGIWSQLEYSCEFPFTKIERDTINKVRKMLDEDINEYTIYKYGLYVSSVCGSIKGISYKKINNVYKNLVIYSKKDIEISAMDIANALNKEPGNYLSKILDDIEYKIIYGELENKHDLLVDYVIRNY